MTVATEIPAAQEDPDLICWGCIVLSPADRKALRGQSVARMMQRRED